MSQGKQCIAILNKQNVIFILQKCKPGGQNRYFLGVNTNETGEDMGGE
jgi:hypothetical protein